jgi:hypothetical protein
MYRNFIDGCGNITYYQLLNLHIESFKTHLFSRFSDIPQNYTFAHLSRTAPVSQTELILQFDSYNNTVTSVSVFSRPVMDIPKFSIELGIES